MSEGGDEIAKAIENALEEAVMACHRVISPRLADVLWETLPKLVDAWAEYEAVLVEMLAGEGKTVDQIKDTVVGDFTVYLASVYGEDGEHLARIALLPLGVGSVALDRCMANTPTRDPSTLKALAAVSYAQAVISRLLAEIDAAASEELGEETPEENMVI